MADIPPVIKPGFGFSRVHGAVRDFVSKVIGAGGDRSGNVASKAVSATWRGTSGVVGGAAGVVTGTIAGTAKNPIKTAKFGAALLAIAAAAGAVFHFAKKKPAKDVGDIDPLANLGASPEALSQATLMGQELTPGAHAGRVLAGRGGVTQQGALNPEMTALPSDSVQNLGR